MSKSNNPLVTASADKPDSVGWIVPKTVVLASPSNPFYLEHGGILEHIEVEYETYGTLSPNADNAILITHALSGDAHAAGWDKSVCDDFSDANDSKDRIAISSLKKSYRLRKPGWWDSVIGPGKPIDTNKFFVICSNFLGSCYGTTGPASLNPATGKPYGLSFPAVMIEDWVRLQVRLIDYLGIDRLYAVIGGSLGGQQALEWSLAYPDRVVKAIVLASSYRLSTQGLAFNAVGRHTILHDPNFCNGNYYSNLSPNHGLASARMLAHITYLSEEGMLEKFGRRLQDKESPDFGFGIDFAIESYLNYQGRSFANRFDANSYLYITRAMDYYDVSYRFGEGDLACACERLKAELMLVSFSSDWLYPPEQCKELVYALCKCNKPVTYVNIPSRHGHDAFLIEKEQVGRLLRGCLNSGKYK